MDPSSRSASGSDWEVIPVDNSPLARPPASFEPRLHPVRQLVAEHPITIPIPARPLQPPDHSGDALARPSEPGPRSGGPHRSVQTLQESECPRIIALGSHATSLNLPRDLPSLDSPLTHPQMSLGNPRACLTPALQSQRSKRAVQQQPPRVKRSDEITRVRSTSESQAIQALLPQFLICFTCYSELLTRLQSSDHGTQHIMRILDGFSPNTVLRYINCLLTLFTICRNLRINLHTLDDIGLADLLMTGASEAGKFSSMTLKAIRWAWRQFALTCFKDCFSPIVSSFSKTQVVADRRESLPLPLLVLLQWERRILQSASTVSEVLVLGTFLLMAFSGMRFGDVQRIMIHKLQYDGTTLRGVAWKTKTCHTGVPFGIICKGFLSKGSHHWVHKFLTILDEFLEGEDPEQIDFLLPSMSTDADHHHPWAMPYSEALYYLRHFLSLPWRNTPLQFANVTHYTVHGLKSTLLSWSSQLRLDPESRRLQGHHKDPLQSTRLYSRDDVNGSIYVQEAIVQQVQTGWQPHTPLGRGGQLPLQEPKVQLEIYKKDAAERMWKFFTFNTPPDQVLIPELSDDPSSSGESSASSSASSSSSKGAASGPSNKKQAKEITMPVTDEVEMGCYRNTIHVIMQWSATDPSSQSDRIRTACGRFFPAKTVTEHTEWTAASGKALCTHPGCMKGWRTTGTLD